MAKLSHIVLAAVMVLITANFASAQQMPEMFLDMLASNKQKLTSEQATQVAGVYNQTELIRLSGNNIDTALKTAIEAAAAAGEASIDFAKVQAQAVEFSNIFKENYVWIPYVDPQSGFFYAYRVTKTSLATSPFPEIKRLLGTAMARPDGSVLLVATNDQDTAVWQGLLANSTIFLSYMEGVEAWKGTELVEDQTIYSAVFEKVKVPERFLNNLKESLPLQANTAEIAAAAAASAATSGGRGVIALFSAVVAVMYTLY